ncbi:hypothetical protein CAPTEDRAFT_178364 [Capitella teleta]|uniref:Sodium-coupled monocarboxylate transporter 1 n=1 Tax=Capitella teleta TaxID=283909 RepID=R7UQX4_CAPTE|nr:hypothetical protein CAPTEDRAFT_178364 [Capitella teleta]|eukprot:ELU08939.1 hypothetical protein CAPTEDRAFT_178364 [Capitella teleta]
MENYLHWIDYIIFGAFLGISILIGAYHACAGGKQKTTEEFLMGNRQLKILPTMVSLFVSYQSAIAILGNAAEVFTKGTLMWLWASIAYSLSLILAERVFVPWIYPLGLTSVYEYFELRYESRVVRIIGASLGILYAVLYMGAALFAPSVALEAATGLSASVSIPLMAVVSVIYTSLGGMKAVIWTDLFQFVVMYAGVLAAFIKGNMLVGGLSRAFQIASIEHRLIWIDFNPDPTIRHSVWGFIFGWSLTWGFVYGIQQSSVQRYCAVPSLKAARKTVLWNIPILLISGTVMALNGILVLAYFHDRREDPIYSGRVTNDNQILAVFVIDVFRDYKGVAGLFLSTLYSGALSSVSSSLSGASANAWEDILKPHFRVTETRAAILNKLLVVMFGILATGVAFVARFSSGPVTQFAIMFFGAVSGPLGAMFLMGGLWIFRKYCWISVIIGGLSGLTFNLWLGAGGMGIHVHPSLPPLSTHLYPNTTVVPVVLDQKSGLNGLYAVSYLWYSVTGLCVALLISTGSSWALRFIFNRRVDVDHLDPRMFISVRQIFSCSDDTHVEDRDSVKLAETQKYFENHAFESHPWFTHGSRISMQSGTSSYVERESNV